VGYYSVAGATGCTSCSLGYKCSSGATSPTPAADICPIGGYCSSPGVYTACPAGTYGILEGGQSLAQACTSCDPGYYCPSAGTIKATRVICPVGTYCPSGTTIPTGCPAGTHSSLTGQNTIATCNQCPRGYYCVYNGTSIPQICPMYYYCPEGTANTANFPCAAGTYSLTTGLYAASQCMNCTLGHYCTGSTGPTACPAGYYNPNAGGSSLSSCLACEAGYACPSTGMSLMNVQCARGYFCPTGTSTRTQYPCPAGTYSDSTSLTSGSGCSQCPKGYSCAAATTSALLVDCKVGHYCPRGTSYGNEISCPAGTYSNRTLLTSVDECIPCLPGYYCSGGASDVSGSCKAGYYCPTATSYPNQFACPSGTYSTSIHLYESVQCTNCPLGYYCLTGSTAASPCPAGSYSSYNNTKTVGPGSFPSCQSCPAGYACPSASTKATECGIGYYSGALSSSCTVCPRGYYCGSNTTTNSSLHSGGGSWSKTSDTAGSCFNGTYCGLGMTRAPDLLRDACPMGYYCPAATTYPIACPAGKYSSSTGRGALSQCLTSPAGYYTAEAATSLTGLCHPGTY
jgi:hypothetical protein